MGCVISGVERSGFATNSSTKTDLRKICDEGGRYMSGFQIGDQWRYFAVLRSGFWCRRFNYVVTNKLM